MTFPTEILPSLAKEAARELPEQGEWKYQTPAYGLFFQARLHPYFKAVRVEAPDIGKEFTDGGYIGKDPEGFLFFNDIKQLDTSGKSIKYRVETITLNNQVGVKVTFKKDGNYLIATFVALDPQGTVAAAGLNNHESQGDWVSLKDIGSSSAVVTKAKNESQVHITANPIHLKASWSSKINGQDVLNGESFSVRGNLWFKGTYTLQTTGVSADYNNDRIVFYSGSTLAKDFAGYFLPYEYPQDDLAVLAKETQYFDGVTWSPT